MVSNRSIHNQHQSQQTIPTNSSSLQFARKNQKHVNYRSKGFRLLESTKCQMVKAFALSLPPFFNICWYCNGTF
ncbi:hypothetical protein RB195_019436 [Necator americanus]|uniref:Uncharacterized protein n=1 Tax=Necator americanus TaxID=51031 RepID=A0ABR1CE57_NECAM